MTDLTIFDLMTKINNKKFSDINNAEIEKLYVPFLIQRWLTGTSNQAQVFLINEYVNPYTFSLHKHKKLLWLLSCIAVNSKQKYNWIKQKQQKKNNILIELISEYYKCSKREAIDYRSLLDDDDIINLAEMLGKDKEEITKIKKELK